MKKIVGIIAAAAMAASVFAVDFNARVYMTGNIANGTIDSNGDDKKEGAVNFWNLAKQDQKDADALVLSANGDKAGAQFQMWYQYTGGDAALNIRSTSLWFKPIDMLKVTIGDVDVGTYCEQIDCWKVATGKKASDFGYSSYATVNGAGLSAELTPIDGLWITAGVVAAPGNNMASITFNDNKEDETYGAYGVATKYSFNNLLGIPLSAAISWRDEGKNNAKILAIGGDYSNGGFYGMLNARLRFEKETELSDVSLGGIALDNYFKYSVGALNIQARLPITIRGFGSDKTDLSYMYYEAKVTYAFDSFNVYLDIENDHACIFDKNSAKETFLDMNVQPGVTFNVGSCALDVGLNVDVPNKKTANIEWSIPFTASVAF